MNQAQTLPGLGGAAPLLPTPAGPLRWFRKRPSGAARRRLAREAANFAKVNGGELPPARGASRRRLTPDTTVSVEAHVYRKDVVLKVRAPGFHKRPSDVTRGEIKCFSAQSARRLRLLIRNTDDIWTGFLTLTYPGASFGHAPESLDGPTVKRHVHAFCQFLRRRKIAYTWILEFQDRGAPHFHFLLAGFVNKTEVARRWFEIVGSNDPRHLAAGTRIESVKNPDQVGAYMGSYMTKLDQKTVPADFRRVGRFWGASRCLSKTLFRMKGLYRDVSRELRDWRKLNAGCRRTISADQLQAADERRRQAAETDDQVERGQLLRAARACELRAHGYAKRWRWKGEGFTLVRGAGAFRAIMRQSALIDAGQASTAEWAYWDGKPDKRAPYQSPEERIMSVGQHLLFGGFEPAYSPEVNP